MLHEPSAEDQKVRFSDIFEYILLEPERYVDSKVPPQVKIRTLNMLIAFFEEEEDYIKCHELLVIKNQILDAIDLHRKSRRPRKRGLRN